MTKTKTCTICGTKYEYCGHCDSNNVNNMWRSIYCSENCRDIYDICGKYVSGKYSISDAYDKLKVLDTNKNIALNGVKKNVEDIMAYGKTITTEAPEKTVIDNIAFENSETPVEDEVVRTKRPRRRFTSVED